MTGPDLDRLFFPERIAIHGISERADAWGTMVLRHLRAGGYAGDVVALRANSVPDDLPIVEDLCGAVPVDVLLVCVPGQGAIDAVAEAAASGVGATIVFSAGFAEDGEQGRDRQEQLVAAAGSMPILGPNCLGVVSGPGRATMSVSAFLTRQHLSGPVGLVTQSGAMGFMLAEQLARRGIGHDYYASTGNEAGLQVGDVLAYVAQRPEVRVLGCYLESVRDVARWRAACRLARDLGRRVVALHVGASAAGRRAALSHTASVVGDAELFEAAARDDGVVLVRNELEFADAVRSLHREVDLPNRPGLGAITMSGGAAAMVADQTSAIADVPAFGDDTRRRLRDSGVALAGDANPVDLTGMFFRHLDQLDEVVDAVADDPRIDAVALLFTFGDALAPRYHEFAHRLAERKTPAWFVWAGARAGEVEAAGPTGVVVDTIPALVTSLDVQRAAYTERDRSALDDRAGVDGGSLPSTGGVLTESTLAPVLRRAGLHYVDTVSARSGAGLVSAVTHARLAGPFAVKIDHPGAPHRARLGLVRLDVDAATLDAVGDELLATARTAGLDDATLTAQPLLSSIGVLSLGALRHPRYGAIVQVGPGGNQVEESGHRRVAACLPLTPTGLHALVDAARTETAGRADHDAIVDAVAALAWLLAAHPQVTEVDVNPLLVRPDGDVVAVDALAVS